MSERKVIMRNGRPYSFDPKTGRAKPLGIDATVRQTGLSPEEMAKKSGAGDHKNSFKENDDV